ncbi:hypothetical protein [Limnohabitans sp. Rim8]|jgi:hypothetical protein|uniref:hypothetical protein n=1 Tax=Limnohabitans sp. Rim8 TaxID=1100718 RepID=UPI0033067529
MSETNASRIAITYDPVSGYPLASEVVDSTLWPSERATRQAVQTLVEIHNLGYEGLRFEYSRLNTSETLLTRSVNLSTPEGRLITLVMELAEQGQPFPNEKALEILKKIYLTEGLTPPTPRPLSEQICVAQSKA